MDAGETVKRWWCCRCQAMVWGPWSRPLLASFSRSSMIGSMVAWGNRVGLVCGRRERVERGLSLQPVALHQARDPTLGDPVLAGHLGLAATLDDDGGDDQASLRHQLTLGRSPYSDVLRHAIRMS
jgi:hypothetical protein